MSIRNAKFTVSYEMEFATVCAATAECTCVFNTPNYQTKKCRGSDGRYSPSPMADCMAHMEMHMATHRV